MSKRKKNTQNNNLMRKDSSLMESTPLKFLEKGEISEKNGTQIDAGSSDPMEALKQVAGVMDGELAINIVVPSGAAVASCFTQSLENKLNVIAQSLHDGQPQDSLEARLIVQSTVAFSHAIKNLSLVQDSDHLPAKEAYTNMAVKFMRVLNETTETLNRYRRRGEQKVTVTHAILANQAVVNNYALGGGEELKNQGDTPCQ